MKITNGVSLCLTALIALTFFQPSFAKTDPSTDGSELLGEASLSSVAAPLLVVAAGGCLGVGAVHQVVKLADVGGNELSELTSDGLDLVLANSVPGSSDVHVTVTANKKEIPLVVRKDYLQLNQEVQSKQEVQTK